MFRKEMDKLETAFEFLKSESIKHKGSNQEAFEDAQMLLSFNVTFGTMVKELEEGLKNGEVLTPADSNNFYDLMDEFHKVMDEYKTVHC